MKSIVKQFLLYRHHHPRRLFSTTSATYDKNSSTKLWGGRFIGDTDPLMEKFNSSIDYDKRLWKVDIRGSKAYATALERANILTSEEKDAIHNGLDQVYKEWEDGIFELLLSVYAEGSFIFGS